MAHYGWCYKHCYLFFVYLLINVFFSVTYGQNQNLTELRKTHDEQQRHLFRFIHSNKCEHIYLDMGTNIGVQIRKLYQPQGYPKAKILSYYDQYFGEIGLKNRKNVCAIGFEGNAIHTPRLLELQDAYTKVGYPVVIFTDTAVWTSEGTMNFYRDHQAAKDKHEWGASTVPWLKGANYTTAISIDMNHLMHRIHALWASSSSHTNNSRTVAKMDIEGSEYEVLPHMITHGSICMIDVMTIEWHANFFKSPDRKVEDFVRYIQTKVKDCKFKAIDMDDETYIDDNNVTFPTSRKLVTKKKIVMLTKI